jgi:hypothetical protein
LWEARNKEGNYPLKVVTRPLDITVQTGTATIRAQGKYEYAINLQHIEKAVGVDETTIEGGITAFILSFLTQYFAGRDAEAARKEIAETNSALADKFEDTEVPSGDNLDSFGSRFGFRTVTVVIEGLELPPAAQEARDAIDEAAQMQAIIAGLYGMSKEDLAAKVKSGEITHEQYINMVNRAMVMAGKSKMDLDVIEGNVPAAVARMMGTIGQRGGNPSRAKPKPQA